jgi:hypothetical protein
VIDYTLSARISDVVIQLGLLSEELEDIQALLAEHNDPAAQKVGQSNGRICIELIRLAGATATGL